MAEKRPQASALRALPEADLRAQLAALRQELWQRRNKTGEGAQPQTHEIPGVKRQVARVLTVLHERWQKPHGT